MEEAAVVGAAGPALLTPVRMTRAPCDMAPGPAPLSAGRPGTGGTEAAGRGGAEGPLRGRAERRASPPGPLGWEAGRAVAVRAEEGFRGTGGERGAGSVPAGGQRPLGLWWFG